MPVLMVIGAAGFLGRYVTRHFHDLGWKVWGLDVASPENAPQGLLAAYRQVHLPDPGMQDTLAQARPELCVHCAGRASVGLSVSEPASDYYDGPLLTFELLNSLRLAAPQCAFIQMSSAAVYGNPRSLPVGEDQPAAPLSPYGYHKWQSELLCQEFAHIYGLRTASLRIFSAYGPGLRRQVMWDICQKALAANELVLQGTGRESRDFVHAHDIAWAVEVVFKSAALSGEFYNLAYGREVFIEDLARLILDALGIDRPLHFSGSLPPGTPTNWCADITRLQALGFQPEVRLEQGAASFARWCRAELQGT